MVTVWTERIQEKEPPIIRRKKSTHYDKHKYPNHTTAIDGGPLGLGLIANWVDAYMYSYTQVHGEDRREKNNGRAQGLRR